MLKQLKSFQLPLIGTLLFFLLAGLYLFASKRFPKPDESGSVTKHKVENSSEEALKYWTADKKRHAKPVALPSTDKIERKKPHSADSQQS